MIESGKRKTSIARATITEGTGKVTINKKNYENLQDFDRLKIKEPIAIAEQILGKINFDVSIVVRGGGEKSQIDSGAERSMIQPGINMAPRSSKCVLRRL